MLNNLTTKISNKRFITYVVLLYVLAYTVGTWVPASSPLFEFAPYVKLILFPLAQLFLLKGARHRWPENFGVIVAASTAFYAGMILSTISSVIFIAK